MTDQEHIEQSVDFKDRKTGLIIFGIIHLIFGGICLLFIPLMMVSIVAADSCHHARIDIGVRQSRAHA